MPNFTISVLSPTKGYVRADIFVDDDTTWDDAAENLVERGYFSKVSDVAFYDMRHDHINLSIGTILDYWHKPQNYNRDRNLMVIAMKPRSPHAIGSAAAADNEQTTEGSGGGRASRSEGSSGASADKPAENKSPVSYGPHPPTFGASFSHLFF